MRQRWVLILLVAVTSFFTGGWLLQQGTARDGNVYQHARLFDDVLSHVSAYYVDSIGQGDLYDKATNGLLEELHDPYPFSAGRRLSRAKEPATVSWRRAS